jgi:hypothetical protein
VDLGFMRIPVEQLPQLVLVVLFVLAALVDMLSRFKRGPTPPPDFDVDLEDDEAQSPRGRRPRAFEDLAPEWERVGDREESREAMPEPDRGRRPEPVAQPRPPFRERVPPPLNRPRVAVPMERMDADIRQAPQESLEEVAARVERERRLAAARRAMAERRPVAPRGAITSGVPATPTSRLNAGRIRSHLDTPNAVRSTIVLMAVLGPCKAMEGEGR